MKQKSTKRRKGMDLIGMWHIYEMETWDEDYFNMKIQAYIEITPGNRGHFQFGLVSGEMDGSDLDLVFDSENLMIYKNHERVSRFYGADELPPEALEPLDYEVISQVEYGVAAHDEKYTVFVPPNLDSSDWVLDGEKAPAALYAAWEGQSGKVEYTRFGTYEISYIISLISVVAIAGYVVFQGRSKIKEKLKGLPFRLFFLFLGLPLRVFPALATSPGRVSRGTSQEYKHGELDRDHNAALNVFKRGPAGLGRPELTPEEMGPPRELTTVPASTVVEAESPHPFKGGQFTTAYLPT